MESVYVGQIMLWSGSWVPYGWTICDGKSLLINQYPALCALIGTEYGGSGQNFNIPDLRGAVPVGVGQGPGLSVYTIAEKTGTSAETINLITTPAHIHQAAINLSGVISAQLSVSQAAATTATPDATLVPAAGASPGTSGGDSVDLNMYSTGGSTIGLSKAISGSMTISAPGITAGNTGGSQPHSNMMPYLSMYYIIALTGTYPDFS